MGGKNDTSVKASKALFLMSSKLANHCEVALMIP